MLSNTLYPLPYRRPCLEIMRYTFFSINLYPVTIPQLDQHPRFFKARQSGAKGREDKLRTELFSLFVSPLVLVSASFPSLADKWRPGFRRNGYRPLQHAVRVAAAATSSKLAAW